MKSSLQPLFLGAAQTITANCQIKGVARVLWYMRSALQSKDGIYKISKDLLLKIDNEQLYQWWNVINYAGFDIVLLLKRLLSQGDLFIDAGANIGYITLHASSIVGSAGRVLALEPEPRVRNRLLENISLNRIQNIEVIPKAVGRQCGTVEFFVATDHGLSRVKGLSEEGYGMVLLDKIKTEVTTIDTVVREYGRGQTPRVIKMDIEGSELLAIEGAKEVLCLGQTIVIFESNQGALAQQGACFVDIYKQLNALGYEAFAIKSNTDGWFRVGRCPILTRISDPHQYNDIHFDAIAIPRSLLNSVTQLNIVSG